MLQFLILLKASFIKSPFQYPPHVNYPKVIQVPTHDSKTSEVNIQHMNQPFRYPSEYYNQYISVPRAPFYYSFNAPINIPPPAQPYYIRHSIPDIPPWISQDHVYMPLQPFPSQNINQIPTQNPHTNEPIFYELYIPTAYTSVPLDYYNQYIKMQEPVYQHTFDAPMDELHDIPVTDTRSTEINIPFPMPEFKETLEKLYEIANAARILADNPKARIRFNKTMTKTEIFINMCIMNQAKTGRTFQKADGIICCKKHLKFSLIENQIRKKICEKYGEFISLIPSQDRLLLKRIFPKAVVPRISHWLLEKY